MDSKYNFRRGAAEIEKAGKSKKSSSQGNFAPSIFWKEDKEERYVLILNDIESIPRLDLINFIPVAYERNGEKREYYETVIARTESALGEDRRASDPMVEDWDAKIADSNIMVAVELEPTLTEVRGRARPTGFTVKTVEFERRIRDDNGELTDETETVTAPAYGFINQAASNFGAAVVSYDASEAPISETPVKIQRIGKDRNTQYAVHGYPEQEVDLAPLLDFVDGINYLTAEELEEFLASAPDEPVDFAHELGTVLLEKRLNELADDERYERLLENVVDQGKSLDRFGGGKGKKESTTRTARPTQRRSAKTESDTAESTTPQEDPAKVNALTELKQRRQNRSKTKA